MIEFGYEDIPELLRLIADVIEDGPPPDGGGTTDPLPRLRLIA